MTVIAWAPGLPPQPTTLPKLKAALTRVTGGTGRGILAMVGDSLTAGWGAGVVTGTGAGSTPGSGGNAIRAQSMPHQLSALYAAAGIPSRSDAVWGNGVTTNNTIAEEIVYNPSLTFGADWATSQLTIGGFALQAVNTGTTSMTFTPEIAADKFDVYYLTSGGNATLTVTDASGTLATINQAASGSFTKVTVSRAAASVLPISIQRNGTGASGFICGIVPYDSTAPRLEIWNMGYAGSKASDWQLAANTWSPFRALLTLTNVDTFTVQLGANDKNASVAAETFRANLGALTNQLKLTGAEVQLIKTYLSTNASYLVPQTYFDGIDAISAGQSFPAPVDFNAGITLVTADRFDGVHLSQTGYAKGAAYLYAALATRTA